MTSQPAQIMNLTAAAEAEAPPAPTGPCKEQARKSLKQMAIRGSVWTILAQGAGQAMRLGSNLILTRLLFPEAFGLMALVSVILAGLQMFSDIGITPSIVQHKRGDDPRFLNTAWTISALRGMGLWIACCVLAYPAALFYDEPALLFVMPIAGLSTVVLGFQSTSLSTLNRHLALGVSNALNLASQFVSVTVMIVWAYLWPSVWALVAGSLAGHALKLIVSHTLIKGPRNRLLWDHEAAVALFGFGKWIFLSTLLTFASKQADRLLLGKLVSLEELGVYSIALVWAVTPTETLLRLGQVVLFPVYARLKDMGEGIGKTVNPVRRPICLLGGWLTAMLLLVGAEMVGLLYDDRYARAGEMLQLLGVGVWFQVLTGTSGPALLALGNSKWLAASNIAKLAVFIPGVLLVFSHWGMLGVVGVLSVAEIAKYLVVTFGLLRYRVKVLGEDAWLTAWLALSVLPTLALSGWYRRQGGELWEVMLLQVALGSIFWLPLLWRLRRHLREASA